MRSRSGTNSGTRVRRNLTLRTLLFPSPCFSEKVQCIWVAQRFTAAITALFQSRLYTLRRITNGPGSRSFS